MFLVVGIIFSSIEQMFPIIVWVGGWALETQRCSQTGAELGNLSPRSKAGQVSPAYGCKKKSPADTHPAPQPTSLPQNSSLPQTPHLPPPWDSSGCPQWSLAWAHEPDWVVLLSVSSASLTGPWSSLALRALRLAPETFSLQHQALLHPDPASASAQPQPSWRLPRPRPRKLLGLWQIILCSVRRPLQQRCLTPRVMQLH